LVDKNVAIVVINIKEIIAEYTDIENLYLFIKSTTDINYIVGGTWISILNGI
jgi:hypothetical protein